MVGSVRGGLVRAALLAATAAVLGAAASSASAATVGITDGTLTFTAASGEVNDVSSGVSTSDSGSVRVSDAGAPVTVVGSGCTQVDAHTATCAEDPTAPLPMVIDTGDGNDRVLDDEQRGRDLTVRAGSGDDTVTVRAAWSMDAQMYGGSGDDTMAIANNGGGLPVMHGGPGNDRLSIAENEGGLLYGDGGDDHLYSRPGESLFQPIRLDGGAGDDVYSVGYVTAGTASLLAPSAGVDTIDLSGVGAVYGPLDLSGCAACVEHVVGSPQDDTIDTRDGRADAVSCGAGSDTVIADRRDVVSGDCETVSRG